MERDEVTIPVLASRVAHATGILIPTSDYEEVVQVADRAAVMAKGRIVAHLEGDAITTERLTEAAGG